MYVGSLLRLSPPAHTTTWSSSNCIYEIQSTKAASTGSKSTIDPAPTKQFDAICIPSPTWPNKVRTNNHKRKKQPTAHFQNIVVSNAQSTEHYATMSISKHHGAWLPQPASRTFPSPITRTCELPPSSLRLHQLGTRGDLVERGTSHGLSGTKQIHDGTARIRRDRSYTWSNVGDCTLLISKLGRSVLPVLNNDTLLDHVVFANMDWTSLTTVNAMEYHQVKPRLLTSASICA